jgi:hypothetical protein
MSDRFVYPLLGALLLTACADASRVTEPDAEAVSVTTADLSSAPVPGCGFLNGTACPLTSPPRCDRGLILSLQSGRCVNHTRRQVGHEFHGTWADWALRNQRLLANDEPVNWVMYVGTHNSYNNIADEELEDPNHVWSITDQLDLGARVISLDLHWFAGAVRLCHAFTPDGGVIDAACSVDSRPFGYAIREIADWVAANPGEVLLIQLEHYTQGRTAEVVQPLEAFLGPRLYRRSHRPGTGWSSRREMLALGKTVIVTAHDIDFGGINHQGHVPQSQSFRDMRNFTAVRTTDGIITGCTSRTGGGALTSLVRANDQYQTVGEDRTVVGTAYYGSEAFVRPADVVDLVDCNIKILSLDFLGAERSDQPLLLGQREPTVERQPYAVWSWTQGDRGAGDAALLVGATGRWRSASPTGQHRFACGLPRSETMLAAESWGDPVGRSWRVTTQAGPWQDGGRACLEEFGDEGYVFSVPVSGFMNGQMRLADEARGDLWLNYNDIKSEGAWTINRRPMADAGGDRVVECSSHHGTAVQLDGSASSDPEDDALAFGWTGPFGAASGMNPTVLLPLGTHVIDVMADDGYAGVSTDQVTIRVVDTTPPVIHAAVASPERLWPPNHRLTPIVVSVDVRDACDANPTCRIVSVASSEPDDGPGDGNSDGDWEITGALTLNLRAERSGPAGGRVYTVTIDCADESGNRTSTQVLVTVPHSSSRSSRSPAGPPSRRNAPSPPAAD